MKRIIALVTIMCLLPSAALAQTATPTATPAATATPTATPTLYPTLVALDGGGGGITTGMGDVMGRASSLSIQPVGLLILGLLFFTLAFEVLRIAIVKRANQ